MENQRALIRRMMIAINRLDGIYDEISKHLGLKANTVWLMYALDDGKPHSQKQISEEWLFPKTTLNTIISECRNEGYLTLEPIPGKRREMYVCLTERGQQYAREALDFIYQAEEKALLRSAQSPACIKALESFCEELKSALEESCERPPAQH